MTSRGWRLVAASLALWTFGRLLGVGDVIQIGLAAAVLCLGALMVTLSAPRSIEVERHLPLDPVHAGQEIEVQLLVRNRQRLPAPLVRVVESLDPPFGEVSFMLSIEGQRERLLVYRLTPSRRGRYQLPATKTVLSDPFGIGHRVKEFGNPAQMIVYPRVDLLPPLEVLSRRRSRLGRSIRVPGGGADDFYAIRDYLPGDDPRQIHWRTSAKVDRLMVREDESASKQRVTIFLDDREQPHRGGLDSFEEAVSSAASAVLLYSKQGYLMRLARTVGDPISFGRGADHYRKILEALALAQTAEGRSSLKVLSRGAHVGGILFAALGHLGPEDVALLSVAARRVDEAIFVIPALRASSRRKENDFAVESLRRSGAFVIVQEPGQGIAEAWRSAIGESSWRASASI